LLKEEKCGMLTGKTDESQGDALKCPLLVLAAGALWGIVSLFIDLLSVLELTSLQIVAVRCLFATAILFCYLLIRSPKLLKIRWRDLPVFVGTGVISLVAFNYCYVRCLSLCGGASVPTLLMYTAPIFVMLLAAVFYREALTKRMLLCLVITLLGMVLITGAFSGKEKVSTAAILFGLGSGFGYALYSLFGKLVTRKYNAVTITFWTFFMGAVASVPLSGVVPVMGRLLCRQGLAGAVGMALCSSVLPFLLYTEALGHMEAGKASVLATMEPLVATVFSAFWFKESFALAKVVGIALILGAIVWLNLPTRMDKLPELNGQRNRSPGGQ